MATSKIQTGDNVKVIGGKFKGQTGIVIAVKTKVKKNGAIQTRVSLNSLPAIPKYQRAMKHAGMPGQVFTVPRTVDVSNVMLVDEKGAVSKTKIEDGNRVFKTTGKKVTKAAAELDVKLDKTAKAKQ